MELPDVLRRRVARAFGRDGESWLATVPSLLDACVDRWGLAGCEPSPVMSLNYLCFASSPTYGQVAVKIGYPHAELYTEIEALRQLGGRQTCRLLDHDADLGALLLERLLPGDDLTTITGAAERTRIAASLAAAVPEPPAWPVRHPLPGVADWTRRAFARARREGRAPAKLLGLVDVAEQVVAELESPARPLVLLHGDLNHWNILRSGAVWKAIDPKGAIGVRCFEAGRFIQNELRMTPPERREVALAEMLMAFAATMGEAERVIAACACVDSVLSTCWSYEEHERRDLSAKVELCDLLCDNYRRRQLDPA